jgi:hypothetical protein
MTHPQSDLDRDQLLRRWLVEAKRTGIEAAAPAVHFLNIWPTPSRESGCPPRLESK